MISLRRGFTTAAVALATVVAGLPGAGPAQAAAAADRCYTAALHQVFLGRPASTYDLEAWTDRYEPAPPRPALPRALAASEEWLEAVVVGIYAEALDRGPDPGGLAFWVERLRGGTRVATLTAQVYGADEVWVRAGATAEGFVTDVFPRIMGRAPSGDDVAFWAGEVPIRGRGGVAKALIGSIEDRRDRVAGLYTAVLGRAPDADGLTYWAGRLATLDDVQLAVHLASSPEAYQQAQVDCAVPPAATTTRATDGDRSSLTPQISADGRWVAFLSRARDLVPGDVQDTVTDLFLWDRTTDVITKVTDTDLDIQRIALSADGRHVAFSSTATEGLPGGDGSEEVYTWDRVTDTVTRITHGNAVSSNPTLSADGRHVAFASRATDLVPGDDPDGTGWDAFVWDRTTGTIERITRGHEITIGPVVSPDGATVAFTSSQDPVTGASTLRTAHLWHRATGTFTTVAVADEVHGFTADGDVLFRDRGRLAVWDAGTGGTTTVTTQVTATFNADITPDGATVTFTSDAGLVPGDTDGLPAVHVWERATGTIVRISPGGTASARPTTSADGREVVYHSSPPPGPNAWADITLWDRGS